MLLERAQAGDGGFFCFPAFVQVAGFAAQVCQVLFEFIEAFARSFVFFLLQSLAFNFKLHDLAVDHIEGLGLGINFSAQAGCGFVDQVNRLVGQVAVGNVTVGEGGGGDDGGVGDAHAVVHFIARFKPA